MPDASLPNTDDIDDARPARDPSDLGFPAADILFAPDAEADGRLSPTEAEVAAVARTAPPLADVIAAAHRAAGIARSSDPTRGWRARSRWSSVIPLVSIRVGNTSSWRDVDDPSLLTVNHGAAFDIRASWRLDELVYDPNELRFETFELAIRRERRKLASLATVLYFRWLRAATPSGSIIRASELAAQLDALTSGWFSEHRTPPNR